MCNHEQVKSVNGVISCLKCGEILPSDFLLKKNTPKEDKPQETPKKTVRKKVK